MLHRRSLSRTVAAAALIVTMAGACTPPPQPPPPLPAPYTGGVSPDLAPDAGLAAYTQPGPYAAGVTTVTIEPGRQAEVWYPAGPAGTIGQPKDTYYIKNFLSPLLQFLLPATVNPPFETDAYRGIPVSGDGPFPLVIFSHGAASFRLQSTFLTTHLASWGFVVVSPDYFERGLQSLLGEPPAPARPDTQVATLAIDAVRAISNGAGPAGTEALAGFAETNRVFAAGHSAGGGTSISLLSRPDVPLAIPMATGVNPDSGSVPAVLSDTSKSIMWMAGQDDGVAALSRVTAGYDYTAGPDKLVVIPQAGHNNAFTDICEIARPEGGIVTLAINAGLPLPDLVIRLGRDGCVSPPAAVGPDLWPITRHFVTAELRFAAGIDAQPVGLGSAVVSQFSPAPATYLHRP